MHLCRKRVFNLTQHFIHLNLSIALLLGLITFVSGIETASEHRVSDNVISYTCRSCFVLLGKLSCCGYTASLFLHGSILLDACRRSVTIYFAVPGIL